MRTKIIRGKTPNHIKRKYFNRVSYFLNDLTCDYPFFEEWLQKVFFLTYTDERMIILCESDDETELLGVCIVKKSKEENKICTIRVSPERLREGIGTHLVSIAIQLLDDRYPLVTVPQKHIAVFVKFFKQFGFKIVSRVKSIYNEGVYEYFFNKPYIQENVLMSIKPRYADEIFNGGKRVEFRRICFPETVKRVYVYSSSPIKRIIGYFLIEKIDYDFTNRLWEKYDLKGAIPKEIFDEYFSGVDKGYAVVVKDIRPFKYGIAIKDVFSRNYTIPQNYRYINTVKIIHRMDYFVDAKPNCSLQPHALAESRWRRKKNGALRNPESVWGNSLIAQQPIGTEGNYRLEPGPEAGAFTR